MTSYATSLGIPPLFLLCLHFHSSFLSLSDQHVGAVAVHIKCYNPEAAGTSGHWCVHMHRLQRGPDVSGCLWQRWFINAASRAPLPQPSSAPTPSSSSFGFWGGRGLVGSTAEPTVRSLDVSVLMCTFSKTAAGGKWEGGVLSFRKRDFRERIDRRKEG